MLFRSSATRPPARPPASRPATPRAAGVLSGLSPWVKQEDRRSQRRDLGPPALQDEVRPARAAQRRRGARNSRPRADSEPAGGRDRSLRRLRGRAGSFAAARVRGCYPSRTEHGIQNGRRILALSTRELLRVRATACRNDILFDDAQDN